MDILRITLISSIAVMLLVGCNQSNSPTQLQVIAKQGENKNYWIQSYTVITNDNNVNWISNNTLGTEFLANYHVDKVTDKQINLNVTAQHAALQIKGFAAYPNAIIQAALKQGLHYQFILNNKPAVTITLNNDKLTQAITNSTDLNDEYHYLQFVISPPFIPATIPLKKEQPIIVDDFMGFKQLNVQLDHISGEKVSIILNAENQQDQLYGKAIINKNTGWIEKMALVKESTITAQTDYKMRTILLMGPVNWSKNNKHQLITEMNINNTKQYTQPFSISGFDVKKWNQKQQEEMKTNNKLGKIYTLNTHDGASQLLLMYENNTGTYANQLGQYHVNNLQINDSKTTALLPAPDLLLNNESSLKEVNIASYKPTHASSTTLTADAVKMAKADVSFSPYQLETLNLPVNHKKAQQAATKEGDFLITLNPTNQNNKYVLSWQAKDNINFDLNLINNANNAQIQYIQPETIAWLTPAESRIIESLSNGYTNTVQLTFTHEIPRSLEINLLKQGDKAAYSYPVVFKRNP